MRSYAIGDIHGHLDLLRQAHDWIQQDRTRCNDPDAPVIHIGDLVDRGPASAGVVDYLLGGQIAGRPWIVLKGNHDRMFSLFLDGKRDPKLRAVYDWWHPRLGGLTTLESYGLNTSDDIERLHERAVKAVPESHRAFLDDLPLYWRRGPVSFVHAGLRAGMALEQQTEDDLTWIRDPFLTHPGPFDGLVVHGHSHIPAARHYGHRVNIDSSAAYGGPLTAIVIEGTTIHTLGPTGRTALIPQPD